MIGQFELDPIQHGDCFYRSRRAAVLEYVPCIGCAADLGELEPVNFAGVAGSASPDREPPGISEVGGQIVRGRVDLVLRNRVFRIPGNKQTVENYYYDAYEYKLDYREAFRVLPVE